MNIQIKITIGLLLASILVNTSSGRYFMKTDDEEEAGSGQDGLTWPFKSQILSMVEHLRDDINSAKQKLRVKNDQLQRSFALLKIDYLKVKYFNDKLTDELQELKTSNQQLKAAQKQIQERLSSVETGNSHGSRSAFSVYMDTGSYRPSVVVPFKGVRYNLGKDYNPATSTYTCPVGGVYYFSYAVHSGRTNNRQGTFAYISVDNQSINSASCSTTGSAGTRGVQRCQATNSATVHCDAGSRVQIKTTGAHIMIYGTTAYDRTTFTGFLLYQD